MKQHIRLFTPGPIAVHPAVLRAAAQQPLYHRGQEFRQIMERVQRRLRMLFRTRSPVVVLTSSATGAHEAVAQMLHQPGTEAVVCINGRFSSRWAAMLQRLGVVVHRVESVWGENIALERLDAVLRQVSAIQSVWVVHCETSTGVLVPLEQIATIVRQHAPDAVLCADVVSSLGIDPFEMDGWGVDVAIASSQKGVGGLPGLALVAIGSRAEERFRDQSPSLYFDLRLALDAARTHTTPFTPAVTLVAALDVALEQIEREELPHRWTRYARDATYLRRRLRTAGYQLFGQCTSHAVTPVIIPPSVPGIVEVLQERYGFIVARGQEHLRDRIIRIGHCGWYRRRDLVALADALGEMISSL
ncbi:MAG: alanine--glyoxylate aminotransferase family protein [Chlorobi bacterium]|nr:alanine--glyoxylate aminotransferase family protein [Chlorobiota bacterium]